MPLAMVLVLCFFNTGSPRAEFSVALGEGHSLLISGSAFMDFFGVNQDMVESELFAGALVKEIISVDQMSIPDHALSYWLSLDRAKLNFTLQGGDVKNILYTLNAVLTNSNKRPVQQLYIYLSNEKAGNLWLGSVKGAEMQMAQCPENFIVATGGIDGAFSTVINMTSGCNMSTSMVGTTDDATKIFYITPRWKGVQLGASITPDSRHWGSAAMDTAFSPTQEPLKTFDLNSIALGVNYSNQISTNVLLGLSALYLTADRQPERPGIPSLQRFPIRSIDIGFVLNFWKRWFVGGEYMQAQNSGYFSQDDFGPKDITTHEPTGFTPFDINNNVLPAKFYHAGAAGDQKKFTAGLGYVDREDAKFGISLSYLHSHQKTGFTNSITSLDAAVARGDAVVLSAERFINPYLSIFMEAAYYDMENPDAMYLGQKISNASNWRFVAVPDNKALAFVIGVKLKM